MTEKRTVALSNRQWRVLLHDGLDLLAAWKATIQTTETLTPENLKLIFTQLDDMKMLATAWYQVGMPPAVPTETIAAPQTNGATAPRKKRGRPSNAELAARAAMQ